MSLIIEIAVDTIEDAIVAERGTAHRIELCSALERDGLSPSLQIIKETRSAVAIPIHVMIRPRDGDFCYTHDEYTMMKEQIEQYKKLGIDGFVLGLLRTDCSIDVERTADLVRIAKPLPVTFHRAFDAAIEPLRSFKEIIQTGAVRLLTSGQQKSAIKGIPLIHQLLAQSNNQITVMPGAGITESNILHLVNTLSVHEVHIGKGAKTKNAIGQYCVSEEKVRRLVELTRNGLK